MSMEDLEVDVQSVLKGWHLLRAAEELIRAGEFEAAAQLLDYTEGVATGDN